MNAEGISIEPSRDALPLRWHVIGTKPIRDDALCRVTGSAHEAITGLCRVIDI